MHLFPSTLAATSQATSSWQVLPASGFATPAMLQLSPSVFMAVCALLELTMHRDALCLQ